MNGARLLVVDDEEINREIISEYLEGEEYEITMVENGERALAALGAQSFDAVILDRMMPGLDGLEVLRRMQHDARLRVVPVIMQTAAAGHDQVAEGLRLGAYYYLTKPYHRDSLVAVVNSAVDVMRRRRALSREIEQYQGLLVLLDDGRFRVRTLPDAHALAAGLGTLAADSPSVALGLVELLINGIEHGNLGISFHDKAGLLAADAWEREVEARLALSENADKYVQVHVQREGSVMRISIRDCGPGFEWRRFVDLDESRALHPNGRGIAVARHIAFRSLEFVEPGNEVIVSVTTMR
jgi:CheY-like chemotaxis protein